MDIRNVCVSSPVVDMCYGVVIDMFIYVRFCHSTGARQCLRGQNNQHFLFKWICDTHITDMFGVYNCTELFMMMKL